MRVRAHSALSLLCGVRAYEPPMARVPLAVPPEGRTPRYEAIWKDVARQVREHLDRDANWRKVRKIAPWNNPTTMIDKDMDFWWHADQIRAVRAVRETFEEAGASVQVVAPYAHFDIPHIGQAYIFYRARMCSPEISAGTESLEVKWVAPNDIPWGELAFGRDGYLYGVADRMIFLDGETHRPVALGAPAELAQSAESRKVREFLSVVAPVRSQRRAAAVRL